MIRYAHTASGWNQGNASLPLAPLRLVSMTAGYEGVCIEELGQDRGGLFDRPAGMTSEE